MSIWPRVQQKREVKAKMPGGLFTSFIYAAMKEAKIKKHNDGTYFAKIPSCPGVWADGDSEDECLITLQEVLEETVSCTGTTPGYHTSHEGQNTGQFFCRLKTQGEYGIINMKRQPKREKKRLITTGA